MNAYGLCQTYCANVYAAGLFMFYRDKRHPSKQGERSFRSRFFRLVDAIVTDFQNKINFFARRLAAGMENSFDGGIPFPDADKTPRGIGNRTGLHSFDGFGGDVPIFRIVQKHRRGIFDNQFLQGFQFFVARAGINRGADFFQQFVGVFVFINREIEPGIGDLG